MSISNLKYDVSVRERMLAKGLLTEAEVKTYLDSLKDVEGEARSVSVAQPALTEGAQSEEEEAPESTERP